MKISIKSIWILCVLSLVCWKSYAEAQLLTTSAENEKWVIHGKGLGQLKNRNPNLKELLTTSPELKISAKKTLMPLVWRNMETLDQHAMIDAESALYFSIGKEELITVSCNNITFTRNNQIQEACVGKRKTVDAKYYKSAALDTKDELHLTFLSPKFHTEKGIRVGNSLADLLKAYPHLKSSLYIYQFEAIASNDFDEVVCFKPVAKQKREDAHFLYFVLRPSKKGKLIGVYSEKTYISTVVADEAATIIAIENKFECNPEEATHVG